MSSENELQISYYSAILAKALKENDGDQFTELYDQICKRATAQEILIAKDKAREYSHLSFSTLSNKITQLLELGVSSLESRINHKILPFKKSSDVSNQNKRNDLSLFSLQDKISGDNGSIFDDLDNISSYGQRSLVELHDRMNDKTDLTAKILPCDLNSNLDSNAKSFDLPEKKKTLNYKPHNNKVKPKKKSDEISKCIDFNLHTETNSAGNEKKPQPEIIKNSLKSKNFLSKVVSSGKNKNTGDSILVEEKVRKKNFLSKEIGVNSSNSRSSHTVIELSEQPRKKNNFDSNDSETAVAETMSYKTKANQIDDLRPCNKVTQKALSSKHLNLTIADSINSELTSNGIVKEKECHLPEKQQNSETVNKNKKKKKKSKKRTTESNPNMDGFNTAESVVNIRASSSAASGELVNFSDESSSSKGIIKKKDLNNSFSKTADEQKLPQKKDDVRSKAPSSYNKNAAAGDASLSPDRQQTNHATSQLHSEEQSPVIEPATLPIVSSQAVTSENLPLLSSTRTKQVLDSTGCSAASASNSNSEEASSTSSTLSNSESTDQFGPVFANYDSSITDLANALIDVAGNFKPLSENSKEVLHLSADRLAETAIDTAGFSKVKQPGDQVQTGDEYEQEMKMDNEQTTRNSDLEKKRIVSEENKDSDVKTENATELILLGLKNKWGLDFFVEDFTQLQQCANYPVSKEDSVTCSFRVSFNNENVSFVKTECEDKKLINTPCASKDSSASQSQLPFNFSVPSYVPGNFNLKKAVEVLSQEWKSALQHATYYRDLS